MRSAMPFMTILGNGNKGGEVVKHFKPYPYQKYAIQFIKDHPEALLFLDLGLGKTIISLMAIKDLMYDEFTVQKVLVIAPLRVAKVTWPNEVKKWNEVSDLRMSVMVGSKQERTQAFWKDADIYVINRENLKGLVDWLEERKMDWPFDMVVIDELSSFKNYKSQRFKALRKIRPFVKRIVGLTGTPASNGLMDLWAEVNAIDRGERLGRFIGRYREAYFKPARFNPYTGVVYNYEIRPGAEEKIYEKISDITVSMRAKDYLKMPDAVTVNHEVEMSTAERKVYDKMKHDLVTDIDGEEVTAANAAVLSNKLLQMADGALYSDDGAVKEIHSRKLDMLVDLMEQANGQPVLISYWFKHDHERIKKRLKEEGYEPRDLKTAEDFADWNAGRIQAGLISPASAGHGLNLQDGGHILVWYSMIWSLELYLQTNGRLHRQGQKNVVTIHHIVCKDTVDEDVLSALEEKDTTQNRLIDAVKANLK